MFEGNFSFPRWTSPLDPTPVEAACAAVTFLLMLISPFAIVMHIQGGIYDAICAGFLLKAYQKNFWTFLKNAPVNFLGKRSSLKGSKKMLPQWIQAVLVAVLCAFAWHRLNIKIADFEIAKDCGMFSGGVALASLLHRFGMGSIIKRNI